MQKIFLRVATLTGVLVGLGGCTGPPGPVGPPGPAGPPGVSGYEVVVGETPVNANTTKQLRVDCPAGKRALGAGWSVLDPTGAILNGRATHSQPAFDGSHWLVNASNQSGFASEWKLRVRVTCAVVASRPSFTLTKIADDNTAVPGGTGTFHKEGGLSVPSLDSGNVAFYGRDSARAAGVYLYRDGSITAVADSTTPIPGGTGTFASFQTDFHSWYPSLDGANVAFIGGAPGQKGVYKVVNGSLERVVDQQTVIPWTNLVMHESGYVAFYATAPGQVWGLYTDIGGTLSVVVDRNTPVPGGTGTFQTFVTGPSLEGQTVAFASGNAPVDGVYTKTVGSSIRIVADGNTLMPGGTVNFEDFYYPVLDGGKVLFIGTRASPHAEGIYIDTGGNLSMFADRNTLVPGEAITFNQFVRLSAAGGHVAFTTYYHPGGTMIKAIFTNINGYLEKVIGTGEVLDGLSVTGLWLGREALHGNAIAFLAELTDNASGTRSEAIYVASSE